MTNFHEAFFDLAGALKRVRQEAGLSEAWVYHDHSFQGDLFVLTLRCERLPLFACFHLRERCLTFQAGFVAKDDKFIEVLGLSTFSPQPVALSFFRRINWVQRLEDLYHYYDALGAARDAHEQARNAHEQARNAYEKADKAYVGKRSRVLGEIFTAAETIREEEE